MRMFQHRFIPTAWAAMQAPDPPGPGASPPPPPPPPSPPPPPAPPPAPPSETAEQRLARAERALADTRAEAAAYRIDARTAKERETAALAELDQARTAAGVQVEEVRRNADTHLQAERNLRVDAELKAAAVSAGLVDPDLLPLIDRRNVKVDANGVITGLPEAIAAFKAAKPAYFRDGSSPPPPPPAPSSTGLGGRPPAPGAAPPTTTVADIPKGKEGKAAYEAAKSAGLKALRVAGG